MAATFDLKTPTNPNAIEVDEFAGTAGAEALRRIRVSKGTGSVLVTVFESDTTTPMVFYIQGTGVDGQPKGQSMRFPAGAYYKRAATPQDPARPHVTGEAWTFCVAGDLADCHIQVLSDISGGA